MAARCRLLGHPSGRHLLMTVRLHRGFTLIELLVAVTIAVVLLVMAMPGYVAWVSDSEIRNAAQSIANGLRTAQSTAVSSNANVQFVLTPTDWTVATVDAPLVILKTASLKEGSRNSTIVGINAASTAATTVAFDPLGRVINNAANLVQVDVTLPSIAGTRPLRVLVGNGRTGVKMCDPAWAWPDPKGCPP